MPKITKNIEGEVGDFVLYKTGKSQAGKKWALYEGFINGEKFKTFDSAYLENAGEKKVFFYSEEEIEGKNGSFTSRTLLPFDSAEEIEPDPFKEMPIIEDKEPEDELDNERRDDGDPGFGATEGEKNSLKGDGTIFEKIHRTLLEILTVLEK